MRPSYSVTVDSLSARARPAHYFLLHVDGPDLAHSEELFLDEGQAERAAEDALRQLAAPSEIDAFRGLVELQAGGLARLRGAARGFFDA